MPTFYAPGTRKGNRFYIVRGSVLGREYEINSYKTDKKDARAAWESFAEAVEKDNKLRPRALKTFGDVADAYLAASSRSARTKRYVERLKKDPISDLRIEEVRYSDVLAAANRICTNHLPQSKNRIVLKPAAAILHFAEADELRGPLRVKRFKEQEPETRRPRDNVGPVLMANTEGWQKVLIIFLFYQGWRVTESLQLRWENVRLRDRLLKVWINKIGKWKDIAMAEEVFETLAPYAQEEGPVFPWSHRNSVYNWLLPLCKKLGVKFTPHMARHDFGGQLREQGATSKDLVDVCTWTSERSTFRYQHAGSDHSRKIIARRKVGEVSGEEQETPNKSIA